MESVRVIKGEERTTDAAISIPFSSLNPDGSHPYMTALYADVFQRLPYPAGGGNTFGVPADRYAREAVQRALAARDDGAISFDGDSGMIAVDSIHWIITDYPDPNVRVNEVIDIHGSRYRVLEVLGPGRIVVVSDRPVDEIPPDAHVGEAAARQLGPAFGNMSGLASADFRQEPSDEQRMREFYRDDLGVPYLPQPARAVRGVSSNAVVVDDVQLDPELMREVMAGFAPIDDHVTSPHQPVTERLFVPTEAGLRQAIVDDEAPPPPNITREIEEGFASLAAHARSLGSPPANEIPFTPTEAELREAIAVMRGAGLAGLEARLAAVSSYPSRDVEDADTPARIPNANGDVFLFDGESLTDAGIMRHSIPAMLAGMRAAGRSPTDGVDPGRDVEDE